MYIHQINSGYDYAMITVLFGTFNTDRQCSHYDGIHVTLNRELANNVITEPLPLLDTRLSRQLCEPITRHYAGGHTCQRLRAQYGLLHTVTGRNEIIVTREPANGLSVLMGSSSWMSFGSSFVRRYDSL